MSIVKIWIIIGALASAAGWILSALGELNAAGYCVFSGLSAVCLVLLGRRKLFFGNSLSWRRIRTRFSCPLPLAFAGLAALIFLGGALYQPSNYDALTYRLPRVLHWLAQGQWHWIQTINYRMNDRSCGFEWLMAPVLVATHSDRALFLINFIPFLLLPGLVFSVFRRLGVTARVAWQWMWLLPTGYNFLLQAASLSNDTFAAVYALAAVDFALRCRVSNQTSDAWFSLLAAALLTGAKSGNLPLLLPWFIAFFPLMPVLFSRPVASAIVAVMALLVSFLPSAIINSLHCGDWTGLSLEVPVIAMRHPLVGIVGNSAMVLCSNFVPTFFPLAGWWNNSIMSALPLGVSSLLRANFEQNFYQLGEIPIEEQAGLGFGLSCLLAVIVLGTLYKRPAGFRHLFAWPRGAIMISTYISLCFFFTKSGMETVARLVSAYYPLLLPALLVGPVAGILVRRPWWKWATVAVLALSFVVVVLTPARPLWPARTILSKISRNEAGHPFVNRARDVYFVYAERSDPLAKARESLPDECSVVGFLGGSNDSEISLWRPFGHRRVEDLLPGESAEEIQAQGIQYAIVSGLYLNLHNQTIESWLLQHQASIVTSFAATLIVRGGPSPWYVVRFTSPSPDKK